MDQKLKDKLIVKSKWLRGLNILLFLFIVWIVKFFILTIAILQFFLVLFTDQTNSRLLEFGEHLSSYVAQVFRYLTYNTEERPYPFAPWPGMSKSSGKKLKK